MENITSKLSNKFTSQYQLCGFLCYLQNTKTEDTWVESPTH